MISEFGFSSFFEFGFSSFSSSVLYVFIGFNCFRLCVVCSCFPVPEPSKQAGDVFKCIGGVFCIEFAYGNG